MWWYVISLGSLNAIATVAGLLSLALGDPWPRRTEKTAGWEVFGVVLNSGLAIWAGYLLLSETH